MAENPALESFIRSIPLFSEIAPDEMMETLRLLRPIELSAGQVLFHQGEPGNAMWVLGPGVEVSVTAQARSGKRAGVIAYARAGETLGEMALVDDGPRSGTAVVVQGGKAHQIEALEFQVLRQSYSPPAFKILRRLCAELCGKLRATSNRIVPPSEHAVSAPPVGTGVRASEADLEAFAPFAKLPKVIQLALTQKLTRIDLAGVQPVFGEGETADATYFVTEGEVTVGRNGKTLATLGPGSMLGLVSVLDHGRRSASCVTTGPARLLRLARPDFDALFLAGNRFAFELVDLVSRQLVAHLRDTNELLPRPGDVARRFTPPKPIAAVKEEDFLPEAEILPLELEMEVAP